MKTLFRSLHLDYKLIWSLAFTLSFTKIFLLAGPYFLKLLIDSLSVIESTSTNYLLLIIAAIIFSQFTSIFFSEIKECITERITQPQISAIANNLFATLLSKNNSYFISTKSGVLAKEFDRGLRSLQSLASLILHTAIPSLIELIAILVIIGYAYDYKISLVVLLTIITLAIYTLLSGKNLLQSRLDLNSADSDLANSLVDVFNNFEAIKIYKAEKETSRKFTLIADKYAAEAINFQDHQSRIKLIQQIIVSIGGGIIYLYLFNLAVKKEISAGDLVMVVSFCHQAFGPATFISGIWQELKKCSIDLKPLLSLMPNNTDVFPKPSSSNQSLLEVCGQLELHQVSLNIGNRQILNNINFRVDSRSLVILCGRSGSGKSTILRLIARLYEPSKGEITLDNVTISDFSLDIYRDSVLLVPQETFLQQATIRDNIKLGLNSLSEQQIRDAAEAAGIHDFIVSLNDGYDTLVGNKGLDLSGGQRQRICLARALARTPKILLLDEPFSALDPLTAHELFSTIKSISKTCTCIITSHHAEYAVEADSVILLRDGTIHAMGQHQELLKTSPHYMNLFGSIS